MATHKNLRGFERVVANLNREIYNLKTGNMRGLLKVADFVRQDMDQTPPLIPVRSGALRDSWFVTERQSKRWFGITMGFSAPYAAFVHEMVGATFTRQDSGAKFFQAALYHNMDRILEIIAEEARKRE